MSAPRSAEGKARRREKNAVKFAAYLRACSALREKGASCKSCEHVRRVAGLSGPSCDLDSDFHGYAIVQLGHVCPRWEAKAEGRAS